MYLELFDAPSESELERLSNPSWTLPRQIGILIKSPTSSAGVSTQRLMWDEHSRYGFRVDGDLKIFFTLHKSPNSWGVCAIYTLTPYRRTCRTSPPDSTPWTRTGVRKRPLPDCSANIPRRGEAFFAIWFITQTLLDPHMEGSGVEPFPRF